MGLQDGWSLSQLTFSEGRIIELTAEKGFASYTASIHCTNAIATINHFITTVHGTQLLRNGQCLMSESKDKAKEGDFFQYSVP